jgi:hypothetical protein
VVKHVLEGARPAPRLQLLNSAEPESARRLAGPRRKDGVMQQHARDQSPVKEQ